MKTIIYPSDSKQKNGKLRLLYEAFPMAYIWEQCGGISMSLEGESILDKNICLDNLHERVPVYLFGKKEYEIYQNI